jgi:hypothetical protein
MRDSVYPTQQLLRTYEDHGVPAISAMHVARRRVSRYGIVDGTPVEGNCHRVDDMVEKPPFPRRLLRALRAITPGKDGELQLYRRHGPPRPRAAGRPRLMAMLELRRRLD